MSTLAQRLVSEAESWIGTRFQHQGRIKNLGVDCVGFISEVAKDAGVGDLEIPNDYRPNEDGTVMLQLLNEHMTMVPTDEMEPGDVLAFCDEALQNPDIPKHLAFVQEVTPNTTFIIHASQHGVRRHRIDAAWRRRIHSVWRIQE
jgi:Cell wall-associated hydrolases (invasion-associated proteins)